MSEKDETFVEKALQRSLLVSLPLLPRSLQLSNIADASLWISGAGEAHIVQWDTNSDLAAHGGDMCGRGRVHDAHWVEQGGVDRAAKVYL